ncbi:MAG TPA: amidohydrolase [Stellaceae bacterium]|nr:amidohydrolase [Stellaceae bacterium]
MQAAIAPDLILANGRVLTTDAGNREFEAVAVKMGRVLAVGGSKEMLELRGPKTEVLDLKGRTVIPGLTDPHVHLADDGAASLNKIDVRDFGTNVRSVPHILEVVRAQARETPPGTWIVGTGSPMQDFRMPEKRFPRREELDAAAPDHPVSIGFGAHITIANSRALALAHVTKDSTPPGGGAIEVDPATGELTGKLVERAQFLVRDVIPPYSYEQMKEGIVFATQRALRRGVTTIHDIVTNNETVRAYQELMLEGRLPIRTSLLIRVLEARIVPESLLNLGLKTGFGNDWLKIGGVKMSIDGGITGRVAAFTEPYADDPCRCGLIRIPAEELDETVDAYHKAGHRVCIHAIGDRAMDMALDAVEKALAAAPRADHRHRIEHLGNWMITAERLARIRRLDVLPVPNVPFLHYIYESLLACMGPARLQGAFGIKTMLASGIPITSGSDGPGYWPTDPLRDMGTSVSRRIWSGNTIDAEEAVSATDALRMFTINAAYNGFDERIKGSIEPGKLADFAVLAQNPLAIEPERIKDIPVDMSIVDGRVAFVHENAADLRG